MDGSGAAANVPGVRVLTARRGRARQMNAGAAAARGEIFLFLHADTRLPAEAAGALQEALADPAVVGGRFDVRLDNPRLPYRAIEALMNWRSRFTGIATGDQALFVRAATFRALGGFPDIPLMEDVEFSRRLKRAGRLAKLRARVVTAARRWERDGLTRTILLMWSLRFLYLVGADPAWLYRRYYGEPAP
jgi:rSAM/selenodomain-associated transferase 2